MPHHIHVGHLVVVVLGALAVVAAMDRLTRNRWIAACSAVVWALLCAACGVWLVR
jgi:hypothetical protein